MIDDDGLTSRQSTRWLSREFAELAARPGVWSDDADASVAAFDVLIVGSGYGGAVAAWELANASDGKPKLSVCVLERGREYLPGAFPARMADLPKHLRGSFAGRRRGGEQLFDIRAGADVNVVLANGLGGGSLINAGVMETPAPQIFGEHWPEPLRGGTALQVFYAEARELLGAPIANTIGSHKEGRRPKTELLKEMAGGRPFHEAAITVAMKEPHVTSGGVKLQPCKLCGDCAAGCNYSAKESLDTNLLVGAVRQGVKVFCGATVLRVERSATTAQLWCVQVVHTDPKMQAREGKPRWIAARTVILAAGTLGSSEILLRSQRDSTGGLRFSTALGKRFSANGDSLLFGYNYDRVANAFANEDDPPDQRKVGPTITGVIKVGAEGKDSAPPITIEEMAIPGPIRRFAEEVIVTSNALQDLGKFDCTPHDRGHPPNDAFAVHSKKITSSAIFAAMGDDGAGGHLQLSQCAAEAGDGQIDVIWPEAKRHPLFQDQLDLLKGMTGEKESGKRSLAGDGRTIANPLWQFLPPEMEFLVGDQRGPIVTVHPLGGCAMADSRDKGVVNQWGAVFDANGKRPVDVHAGLYVLDGSIIPTSLCTNPALTITALALRAMRKLRGGSALPARPTWEAQVRPVIGDVATQIAARSKTQKTEVEFTERLAGRVRLGRQPCWVELTLTYDPLPIRNLFAPVPETGGALSEAALKIAKGESGDKKQKERGQLRIFLERDWKAYKHACRHGADVARRAALLKRSARFYVSGELVVMEREPSRPLQRLLRGACAWATNRGVRDIVLDLAQTGDFNPKKLYQRMLGMLKLATRAGEVRMFRYSLRIDEEQEGCSSSELAQLCKDFVGEMVQGIKRITYARPSNPWRQLQELTLTRFPALRGRDQVLTLDPQYLAARSRPLFGIVAQREHAEALMDVVSLAGYLARMLLNIHVWSARKPDPPKPQNVRRLPGKLPKLRDPEVHTIEVDRWKDQPVLIRLTRYRGDNLDPDLPPIVMFHGYSASGTTFAHPLLNPSMAGFFVDRGRDAWVVDMRSSCGMPTGALPWTMERVGLMDIPAAIDYIWWKTGERRLDVIAHCMGAVMFSMGVLSADRDEIKELLSARDTDRGPMQLQGDRFRDARKALPLRIRRAVLSQNGPLPIFTQPNIFRGYVMSYFAQMFGSLPYAFRPEPEQGLALDLMDRLFATVPYPDAELEHENSWRVCKSTRYAGTRHRIDALYNRSFKLANMSAGVLENIDDFFGPMNLDTLAQVIQFAQHETITNRGGRNRFVSRDRLQWLWRFPTMSVHSDQNGLADVATLDRMAAVFRDAGVNWRGLMLSGRGHQDSVIGEGLEFLFRRIDRFFKACDQALEHA